MHTALVYQQKSFQSPESNLYMVSQEPVAGNNRTAASDAASLTRIE